MSFRRGWSALTFSFGAGEREAPLRVGDFLREALLLDILCLVLRGSRGLFRRREVDFYPLLGLTFHVRTTRMGEEKVVETLGEECSLLLGDPLARWPVLKSLMRGGL